MTETFIIAFCHLSSFFLIEMTSENEMNYITEGDQLKMTNVFCLSN